MNVYGTCLLYTSCQSLPLHGDGTGLFPAIDLLPPGDGVQQNSFFQERPDGGSGVGDYGNIDGDISGNGSGIDVHVEDGRMPGKLPRCV